MTPQEIADYYGVSVRNVMRMISHGVTFNEPVPPEKKIYYVVYYDMVKQQWRAVDTQTYDRGGDANLAVWDLRDRYSSTKYNVWEA